MKYFIGITSCGRNEYRFCEFQTVVIYLSAVSTHVIRAHRE